MLNTRSARVALLFIGEAPLAVDGPHQARRGRRDEPYLREAGSEALELEDERVALLLRENGSARRAGARSWGRKRDLA